MKADATTRRIYCCGCQREVDARLTNGKEIYPRSAELKSLPFWKCDACKNYVGCHHKTASPTTPLGDIPTAELRAARIRIHKLMDPLWKRDKKRRAHLYRGISKMLGYTYHTGTVISLDEAKRIEAYLKNLSGAAT